jgi:Mn-containing catalase
MKGEPAREDMAHEAYTTNGVSVRGPWNQGQGPWESGERWTCIEDPHDQVIRTRGQMKSEAVRNQSLAG